MADDGQTFLRVGGEVFPVYGDELRGWSPRADDFTGEFLAAAAAAPWVYGSIDELFFALVNLCVGGGGEA